MSIRHKVGSFISSLEQEYETYNTISISASSILSNYDLYKKLTTNKHIIPVLKSNAYGHGLSEVATILKQRQMPYIAVDGYFEALQIHQVSKQPVLIMGAILPINFAKIDTRKDAFVIHQIETIEAMAKTAKQYKVHIEIETGMGRHGVRLDELSQFLTQIKKYNNITVEGVMTHLADADNPSTNAHVALQSTRFDSAVTMVEKAGFQPTYIHMGQSAGSLRTTSAHTNTIRLGISLYGISPFFNTDPAAKKLLSLKPALTLKSKIAKILPVDAGESISYGCTFTAKRDSRIGILPLGYYEGLPRALSNQGLVAVHDQYVPIVGRVCMNHTMIDLTDATAVLNDEVTVISARPDDKNSVQNICRQYKLFNYSFLTSINQSIRRKIAE